MTENTPEQTPDEVPQAPHVPAEPEGLPEDQDADDLAGEEVDDPTVAEEDK